MSKAQQSADNNIVLNRFPLKYQFGDPDDLDIGVTTSKLDVIYAVNKVTGGVTVYENKTNFFGFNEDLRNINPNTLTPIATWNPDPNNSAKGEWVSSDPNKTYGSGGSAGTWDELINGSYTPQTPGGVTNQQALNDNIADQVNGSGLLGPDQKKTVKFPKTDNGTIDPKASTESQNPRSSQVTNPEPEPQKPLNAEVSEVANANVRGEWGSIRNYKYPKALPESVSDMIQFQIVEYKTQAQRGEGVSERLRSFNNISALGSRSLPNSSSELQADTKGTINLAIQPPVTDSNGVNWTDSGINLVQLAAAGLSLGFIEGGFSGMFQSFNDIGGMINNDREDIKNALKIYFAQQASQTSGLQSRLTGSVLNPNLETLFEGPRTRTFTYRFQFTPRDDSEAVEVRSIIRAFKEAMAVKRTSGNSFLKAPYVFNIRYLYKNDDNPYIGRVKGPCALKDMSTDYTPQGTYMSFDSASEGDGSMIAYNVTLVFQELDPIYFDDYTGLGDINGTAGSIGY